MIPNKEECFKLMDEYDMLDNIKEHSILVNLVALCIGTLLNIKGHNLNLKLIEASALLHDITKIYDVVYKPIHKNSPLYPITVGLLGEEKIKELKEKWISLAEIFDISVEDSHAVTGSILLSKLGYKELVNTVGKHISPIIYEGNIMEEEVVCYADKRVMNNSVVTLEKRFKDIIERYYQFAKDDEKLRIDKLVEVSKKLEDRIFSFLDIYPENLIL